MNRQLMKVPRAAVWLALGLAIGSSSTVLIRQLSSSPTPIPNTGAENKTPPKASLTTALLVQGEPTLGSSSAPLTVVKFSDFECTYCRQFHDRVMPRLKRQYINTGLVRFIHKDLPLSFHRQAKPAAAAARCAGEQGSYWNLYSALFAQQACLECKGAVGIAKELSLDTEKLKSCMRREATLAVITANVAEAQLHNIRATPTFVIGPSRNDGKHHGIVVEGAMPWPRFKALINQQLQAQKTL